MGQEEGGEEEKKMVEKEDKGGRRTKKISEGERSGWLSEFGPNWTWVAWDRKSEQWEDKKAETEIGWEECVKKIVYGLCLQWSDEEGVSWA